MTEREGIDVNMNIREEQIETTSNKCLNAQIWENAEFNTVSTVHERIQAMALTSSHGD